MIFRNYPVLRLLIPLVFGICLAYFFNFLSAIPFLLLIMLILCLVSFFIHRKSNYKTDWLSGFCIQIIFVFTGFGLTNVRYRNDLQAAEKERMQKEDCWLVKVIEPPVEKAKTYKVLALVEQNIGNHYFKKKVMLYLGKNKVSELQYGDILLIHGRFSEIEGAKNPYAFNYKTFMARKGVFYSAYIPANQWKKTGRFATNPIVEASHHIQQYFSRIFADAGMSGAEYSIITAILLGNDETMQDELKASYASAGVSHILCVSGMHVGIIFMILDFLLKPLDYSRQTRIIKTLILMLSIWVYACITGLSPSVTRAASMFSFVSLGGLLRRNTNIFHSLFASLFILLIINPLLLFELGFQLSYLAVFGIVVFQKRIVELWTPKNKLLQYFWNLISVSVAAQLTTFPLSVYYFGQFPNYFLLANMSVISLSFVVVVSGVALLALSWVPYVASILSWLLTKEIQLMNFIITSIEKMPGSVTRNISISSIQMLLMYLVLVFFLLLLLKKKKVYYWLCMLVVLMIVVLFDYDKIKTQNIDNQTIYCLSKGTAVSFNYHGHAVVFSDSIQNKSQSDYQFSIQNHERKERVHSVIVPIDTDFYQNDFLMKHGDFVRTGGKTYYLAHSKKYYYPAENRVHVDVLMILRSNIRTEYLEKTIDFDQKREDKSYFEKK